MTIQCPLCFTIFKTANDTKEPQCPFCEWDGKWKPEPDPGDIQTREIDHPALRSCH
jgi:hypothetical protein